jgi:hypothetical protein
VVHASRSQERSRARIFFFLAFTLWRVHQDAHYEYHSFAVGLTNLASRN